MRMLSCPESDCGNSAIVEGRGVGMEAQGHSFARRGKLRGRPVFKCLRCSAILIVKSPLFGDPQPRAVNERTWHEMEVAWASMVDEERDARIEASMARNQELEAERNDTLAREPEASCPVCGKRFPRSRYRDQHLAAKHPQASAPGT